MTAQDWKDLKEMGYHGGPNADLTAEYEALIEATRHEDAHPGGYDGPCACRLCMSHAACWKDEAEDAVERFGWGSPEHGAVLARGGGTCMLADGHAGPHEFSPDAGIGIERVAANAAHAQSGAKGTTHEAG